MATKPFPWSPFDAPRDAIDPDAPNADCLARTLDFAVQNYFDLNGYATSSADMREGVTSLAEIHNFFEKNGYDPLEFDRRVEILTPVCNEEILDAKQRLWTQAQATQPELLAMGAEQQALVRERATELAEVYLKHSGRLLPRAVEFEGSATVLLSGISAPAEALILRIARGDPDLEELLAETEEGERKWLETSGAAYREMQQVSDETDRAIVAVESRSLYDWFDTSDAALMLGRTDLLQSAPVDADIDKQMATWALPHKHKGIALRPDNPLILAPPHEVFPKWYEGAVFECWSTIVRDGGLLPQLRVADTFEEAYIPMRARAKLATLLRVHLGFLHEATARLSGGDAEKARHLTAFARLEAPFDAFKRQRPTRIDNSTMSMAEYAAAHILYDDLPSLGDGDSQCLARAVVQALNELHQSTAMSARVTYDTATYDEHDQELQAFLRRTSDEGPSKRTGQAQRIDDLLAYVRLVFKTSMRLPSDASPGYSWFGRSLASRRLAQNLIFSLGYEGNKAFAGTNPARLAIEDEVALAMLIYEARIEQERTASRRRPRTEVGPSTPRAKTVRQKKEVRGKDVYMTDVEEEEAMTDGLPAVLSWFNPATYNMPGFGQGDSQWWAPSWAPADPANPPDWAFQGKNRNARQIWMPVYGTTSYNATRFVKLAGGGLSVSYAAKQALDFYSAGATITAELAKSEARKLDPVSGWDSLICLFGDGYCQDRMAASARVKGVKRAAEIAELQALTNDRFFRFMTTPVSYLGYSKAAIAAAPKMSLLASGLITGGLLSLVSGVAGYVADKYQMTWRPLELREEEGGKVLRQRDAKESVDYELRWMHVDGAMYKAYMEKTKKLDELERKAAADAAEKKRKEDEKEKDAQFETDKRQQKLQLEVDEQRAKTQLAQQRVILAGPPVQIPPMPQLGPLVADGAPAPAAGAPAAAGGGAAAAASE